MFKQKKLSFPVRLVLSVVSFLLGVALFVSALATALIANIQIVTSEDHIRGLVREMMSAPAGIRPKAPLQAGQGGLRIAPKVRTHQMIRREEPEDVAEDLTEQVIDMFYEAMLDQFETQFEEEIPVSKEEFVELVEESTVKDYIADKTAALITDYFNDEVTTTFEPEEVIQLIEENADIIESITGEPMPEDFAQQIATVFNENEIIVKVEEVGLAGFMDLDDFPGLSDIVAGDSKFSIKNILGTVRKAASQENLIWGILICLVLIAAIILVNIRQLPRGLRRAGYPLMLAGLLVVLNLLAWFVPEMWELPGLNLVRYALLQTAVINFVLFGTGLALCVGGIILGFVLRVKRLIPVATPAAAPAEQVYTPVQPAAPVNYYSQPAQPAQPEYYSQPAQPAQPESYSQPVQPESYGQTEVLSSVENYGQTEVLAPTESYGHTEVLSSEEYYQQPPVE